MKSIFSITIVGLLLTSCGSGVEEAPSEEAGTSHDIHQLMTVVIDPQAKVFWESFMTISDEQGTREIAPKTDQDWLRTQSAAATIAEMGKVLRSPQYAEGRGGDWEEFAASLSMAARQAEDAAANRDKDKVLETGSTLYNVCTACHEVYLPKPE